MNWLPYTVVGRRTSCRDSGGITDGSVLLLSEYRHHGAVQIEDQPGALSGQMYEGLQQSIIDAVHLLPEGVRGGEKEAPQGVGGGEVWKAGQELEGAVGT